MTKKMSSARAINHLIKTLSVNDQISTEGISDGYHTFGDLYNQRLYLTAALFNLFPDRAYKTLWHDDGQPCFGGGWFLVSIETPNGPYSYHYKTKFWNLFKIPEREKADPWDGHTSKDVKRLLSLGKKGDISLHSYAQYCSRQKLQISTGVGYWELSLPDVERTNHETD